LNETHNANDLMVAEDGHGCQSFLPRAVGGIDDKMHTTHLA